MRERLTNVLIAAALLLGAGLCFQPVPASAQESFYIQANVATDNVVSADEQSSTLTGWAPADLIGIVVNCTEDSGTATLDIALQRSLDRGATWVSIVSMTQLSATGAETKIYADVEASSAQWIGDMLRVNYDVTGTGQYTCDVDLAGEA